MLEKTKKYLKNNRSRQLFQNINDIRKGFETQIKFLKNSDSSLITGQNNILANWKDYSEAFLNCKVPKELFTWSDVELKKHKYPVPSRIEIIQQINRLKSHKTLGKMASRAKY